ncbi:MAG: CBS domain-containing protein [Nanoarchaeota archaeon]|nr:CBS domain-containing protein [Nanoarchaeota archaeon]MBU4308322.1 CBS domain-containing protein [Nanoarchaeota archaeon]
MERVLVADIMTKDPITAKADLNLLDCAKKMVKGKVGSLILADKKKLIGLITQRDILWALVKKSKEDLKTIKAVDISPKKLATIKPSSTIKEALSKMKKLKFERLPVIQNNELVGMLTIKDILNFHPELYPELDEFAKIREESRKLKGLQKLKEKSPSEGICEECGAQDFLYRINGMLICESCRNAM